jgi:hypothetical protein
VSVDGFAEGHRVARAVGWLIPLGMLVLVWVVLAGRGKLLETSEVDGRLIERQGRTWLVETADGDRVRLLSGGTLQPGSPVRLKRMEYSSGKRRYALLEAPSRP